MNPENFPPHIKQLFQNRELTTNQKIATLAAFMPDIPGTPAPDDHRELGMKIKHLAEEGKIRLGKFDKNFILEIETVA